MQIQDNIIIAHEVYHYLKLKKEGKKFEVDLKIDMNKAYDHPKWDFLEAIIKRMGFAALWIKLIVACITSISFAVVINGKLGANFLPSRGLRQGDPISPYLFLIASEVLSLNI